MQVGVCSFPESIIIGMNREEHGQGAGLRTTLLVCLAASISMIQVNLSLGVVGKASNSFVVFADVLLYSLMSLTEQPKRLKINQ